MAAKSQAKKFKTGMILKHKPTGHRYQLIGEVANRDRGAHSLYSVCDDSTYVSAYPGFFPFDEYTIERKPRKSV